jgi:hypothetical protein
MVTSCSLVAVFAKKGSFVRYGHGGNGSSSEVDRFMKQDLTAD